MSNRRKVKRLAFETEPPAASPPPEALSLQAVMAVRVGVADLNGDLVSRVRGRADSGSVRASAQHAMRVSARTVQRMLEIAEAEKWLQSALLMGWVAGGWLLGGRTDDDDESGSGVEGVDRGHD